MPVDTPYKIIREFRKQAREFTDDELSDAINNLKREVFKRSTYGDRPHLSLYFAKEWVRVVARVFAKPNNQKNEIVMHGTSWPMLIPAHKQERKKKLEQLTEGKLKHLGHKSGLNLASPKQFNLESPANKVAYRLYTEHYWMRNYNEEFENPVPLPKALRMGDPHKINEALVVAINKLPRLSSKNYKKWVGLVWKRGQYVNKKNIMKWGYLNPLIESLSPADRTLSVVRSRLEKGFKAIAQRA